MVKLCVIACILASCLMVVNSTRHYNAPSPAPSTDCSSIIYDMADCISFLSDGSNETKPEGSCCSGFKTVFKTDPHCICEAIKSSGQLGIVLNITKAGTLPSACGVSAPPLSNCGSNPPKSPPKSAPSPKSPKPSAPVPPTTKTPAPTKSTITEAGVISQVSAPSPAASGAYSTPTSVVVLTIMLSASFCYILA